MAILSTIENEVSIVNQQKGTTSISLSGTERVLGVRNQTLSYDLKKKVDPTKDLTTSQYSDLELVEKLSLYGLDPSQWFKGSGVPVKVAFGIIVAHYASKSNMPYTIQCQLVSTALTSVGARQLFRDLKGWQSPIVAQLDPNVAAITQSVQTLLGGVIANLQAIKNTGEKVEQLESKIKEVKEGVEQTVQAELNKAYSCPIGSTTSRDYLKSLPINAQEGTNSYVSSAVGKGKAVGNMITDYGKKNQCYKPKDLKTALINLIKDNRLTGYQKQNTVYLKTTKAYYKMQRGKGTKFTPNDLIEHIYPSYFKVRAEKLKIVKGILDQLSEEEKHNIVNSL